MLLFSFLLIYILVLGNIALSVFFLKNAYHKGVLNFLDNMAGSNMSTLPDA